MRVWRFIKRNETAMRLASIAASIYNLFRAALDFVAAHAAVFASLGVIGVATAGYAKANSITGRIDTYQTVNEERTAQIEARVQAAADSLIQLLDQSTAQLEAQAAQHRADALSALTDMDQALANARADAIAATIEASNASRQRLQAARDSLDADLAGQAERTEALIAAVERATAEGLAAESVARQTAVMDLDRRLAELAVGLEAEAVARQTALDAAIAAVRQPCAFTVELPVDTIGSADPVPYVIAWGCPVGAVPHPVVSIRQWDNGASVPNAQVVFVDDIGVTVAVDFPPSAGRINGIAVVDLVVV